MRKLQEAFKSINPYLSEEDFSQITPDIIKVDYKKGDYLIKSGQIATNIYYLIKGGVKCYSSKFDRILWAEFEDSLFTIPDSYYQQRPSMDDLICVEDTSLYKIRFDHLETLYRSNIQWANFGRKLAENWLNVTDLTYKIFMLKSATEKYEAIQVLMPDIIQRASLKDIASFLGISQVSISRIRADKQEKKRN